MRYERQIPQFDNIVEIEPIDPVEFREARWRRRADKMERDALEVIESMVMKAKRKLRLVPDEIQELREESLRHFLDGQRAFLSKHINLQRQLAAQQNSLAPSPFGFLGGFMGAFR